LLPCGWRLEAADRGEVDEIARSEHGWHLAWLEAGATCWLGRIDEETAFRTWTAESAVFIRPLIPWIEPSERSAYVFDVETRDDMRRRRVASRFLAAALCRLTNDGFHRAWVRVEPENLPSRRLFRDLGFQEQALLTELSLRGRRLLWRQTSTPRMPQ